MDRKSAWCLLYAPKHTYQFLTKNPARYSEFKFRSCHWLGTTVENSIYGAARVEELQYAADCQEKRPHLFVSIEPILGEFYVWDEDISAIDQLIVGAMTGPGAIKPKKEWLESVIATGHPSILWKKNVRPFLDEYGLVV